MRSLMACFCCSSSSRMAMSSSLAGSIALSMAALAFDFTARFMRPKMPMSFLRQAVLPLALAELIIREPQHLRRLPLVVARLLESFHADRALEGLDPRHQRRARVVPRGERLERLLGRGRGRRQRRLDVGRLDDLVARRVDRP